MSKLGKLQSQTMSSDSSCIQPTTNYELTNYNHRRGIRSTWDNKEIATNYLNVNLRQFLRMTSNLISMVLNVWKNVSAQITNHRREDLNESDTCWRVQQKQEIGTIKLTGLDASSYNHLALARRVWGRIELWTCTAMLTTRIRIKHLDTVPNRDKS